jgi:hypothetical protein
MDLTPGEWYHVVYKAHRANYMWYEWEFTAPFLNETNDFGKPDTHWNLRPLAGTTTLPVQDIISAKPVVHDEIVRMPPKLPRRVQGGRSGKSSDA